MEKKRIQKIWLFLRRLFYDSSTVTVIFIIVIAGIGGYLIYSKKTGRPPADRVDYVEDDNIATSRKHETPSIDNTAITDAQKQNKKDPGPTPKNREVVLNIGWDVASEDEDPEPDLENLSNKFEEETLRYTDAEKIKVESKNIDTPGYVAFMSRPEGFEKGIPAVMKDIADRYLETFSKAPRVTVALIVGGGVKSRQTFLRDPEFGVISGSEKAKLNQEKNKIE
jgi:hypothetical protein